jgi:hypothetical protein
MIWSDKLEEFKSKYFKYRLKKQYRKPFRYIFFSIVAIIIFSILYSPVTNGLNSLFQSSSSGRIKVDQYRDYNDVHLRWARHNGVSPFKTTWEFHEGIREMVKSDRLEKISSNKYYVVKSLSHSHPYLTPRAAKLLEDLGKRFRKKLDDNGIINYSYEITSLLRTKESQKNLSRTNGNATNNTSHMYGTTFDISYGSVVKRPLPWMKVEVADAKAIKLLSEAIGELRREGRCVVVTERIEKCFHITVVQ